MWPSWHIWLNEYDILIYRNILKTSRHWECNVLKITYSETAREKPGRAGKKRDNLQPKPVKSVEKYCNGKKVQKEIRLLLNIIVVHF